MIVEKWIRLILYHLAKDIHRYGTLKRAIRGVSGNVLIQQLKERERNEIIARMPSSKFHTKAFLLLSVSSAIVGKGVSPAPDL